MKNVKVEQTSNKLVQTTIHCFPHIILNENDLVLVYSDRGTQTCVSVTPVTTNSSLYSQLQFTSYQVIVEGAVKELDLPRKALLQWKLPEVHENLDIQSIATISAIREESETRQKSVLKKSNSAITGLAKANGVVHHHHTMPKSIASQEVQTTLSVSPHVLESDQVANVFTELSIQTSITCLPNDSVSKILPQLKANLSHSGFKNVVTALSTTTTLTRKSSLYLSATEFSQQVSVNQESSNIPGEIEDTAQHNELTTNGDGNVKIEAEVDTKLDAETDIKADEEIDGNTSEEANVKTDTEVDTTDAEIDTKASAEVDAQTDIRGDAMAETEAQTGIDSEVDTETDKQPSSNVNVVTMSATKIQSRRKCECGSRTLGQIARKLRVQASTLQLTPKVFPPDLPFEQRITEVLNTTVAVLQTEMAKLMEIYIGEEEILCACSSPEAVPVDNTQKSKKPARKTSEEIRADPRSCACFDNSQKNKKPTPNTSEEIRADPRSCACFADKSKDTTKKGSHGEDVKQEDFKLVESVPETQKEVRKITTTRRTVDPNTNKRNIIEEDTVEETIRRVILKDDNETVIEERVKTTTFKTKPSESNKNIVIQETSAGRTPQPCSCPKESNIEVIRSAGDIPVETETAEEGEDATEPPSEATETLEYDEGPSEAEEVPAGEAVVEMVLTEDATLKEAAVEEAPPEGLPVEEQLVGEASAEDTLEIGEKMTEDQVKEEQRKLENPETELPEPHPETGNTTHNESVSEELHLVGDYKENRRLSFIPCECHPSASGAAPPSLTSVPSVVSADEFSDLNSQRCRCSENINPDKALVTQESSEITKDIEPSPTTGTFSSPATDMPLVSSEALSPEKTIKFEFLMKKGVNDVQSQSATSAIVVRATISCPDTNKDAKQNVEETSSLPDLREQQVIRLSVIYKQGSTEPETLVDELLTPGRQLQIASNKSPTSYVEKKSGNKAAELPKTEFVKPKELTYGTFCECGRLVCAKPLPKILSKESPRINNNPFFPGTSAMYGVPLNAQENSRQQRELVNLPIQTEKVPFSAMACPARPVTVSPCIPSCVPTQQTSPPPPPPALPYISPSPPTPAPPPSSEYTKPGDNAELEIRISVSYGAAGSDALQSLSFMYEHDVNYDEPYMEALLDFHDSSTGVQTDLALGDKLQSESLNSLTKQEYDDDEDEPPTTCSSKTEIPWQKISLQPPGSYNIKSSKEIPTEISTPDEDVPVAAETNLATPEDETPAPEQEPAALEEEPDVPEEEPAPTEEEPVAEEGEGDVQGDQEEGGGGEGKEGNEGEKDEEESVAEEELDQRRTRKQPLVFESDQYKHNEPYMEGLYRAYPNSDDEDGGECGSQTEIPWKDILVPENCKIRKMKKTKKCTCRSGDEKQTGTFIPSTISPRKVEDDDDYNDDISVMQLHLGFEEPPSCIMTLEKGGAAFQPTISVCSTISDIRQHPKRCPKKFLLLVDLESESNYSVSFQVGERSLREAGEGTKIHPGPSQPFAVSTQPYPQGKRSIVDIKASSECPFPSEKIALAANKQSTEISVVNPSNCMGAVPTETRSCTVSNTPTAAIQSSVKSVVKSTSSVPQIAGKTSVKATLSLKKMNRDAVVSQEMNLAPGENVMVLRVPGEPVNVQLKMSTPQIPPEPAVTEIFASEPSDTCGPKSCDVPSCQATAAKLDLPQRAAPAIQQPAAQPNVFLPATCTCKDRVKLNTFKQDPVMAALEAYEAEMKPLRQALTQLQQKIRNLNMPEMKGCSCTTALRRPQQQLPQPNPAFPTSSMVRSRIHVTTPPGATARTTMRVRPLPQPSYDSPSTCPFFQPPGFRPPGPPPLAYGHLPPPVLSPRYQGYMAPPPNYMPQNVNGYQQDCFCGRHHGSSKDSTHSPPGKRKKRSSREYLPRNEYDMSYPRQDLAVQARNYGMYPDYRGRNYPDETAYRDSCCRESQQGAVSHDRIRHAVSGHSTDFDSGDSQAVSDVEESYGRESRHRRCLKNLRPRRSGSSRSKGSSRSSRKSSTSDGCSPCRDEFEGQVLRPGQALKTGPDEFVSRSSHTKRASQRNHSARNAMPKVISKQRIQIKFPHK